MKLNSVIGRYLTFHFAKWVLGIFVGILLLVYLLDAIELLRKSASRSDISVSVLLAASALRVPVIMGRVIPFTVLLGSIAAFLTLSRKSELVIARASGLSVWQFMAPGLAFAFAFGLFMSLVYDPFAVAGKSLADDMLASRKLSSVESLLSDGGSAKWMRQRSGSYDVVMHVGSIGNGGALIVSPVFWLYNDAGQLVQRIEAESGDLADKAWHLSLVTLIDSQGQPRAVDSYELATEVTAEQVASGLGSPDTISLWRLPATIDAAKTAFLPTDRFSLQFQTLLARPLLLASMVIIAATVSLGLSRSGGTGTLILSGIVAGFVLYVVTEIAKGLGSEGLVAPALAAWSPALVAVLLGSTVLLFREDG